jgi:AcrR family transcriptional regulator
VHKTAEVTQVASDTKERIVNTTAELFRRQGYTGTGLKQIVAGAAAPFGSVYHFFPGGKEQLGAEVIRVSGRFYQELVEAVWDAPVDPISGVADVFAGAAETLRETDYADACPIATVALEVASTNDVLRDATAQVFAAWIDSGVERFVAAGIGRAKARELAFAVIALLEGAFILSRAARTTEALEAAGATAVAQVRAAMTEQAAS